MTNKSKPLFITFTSTVSTKPQMVTAMNIKSSTTTTTKTTAAEKNQ